MMLSRLVMGAPHLAGGAARTVLTGGALRQFVARQPTTATQSLIVRQFQRDSRETLSRTQRIAERQTLRERAMAPVGPNGECVVTAPMCVCCITEEECV